MERNDSSPEMDNPAIWNLFHHINKVFEFLEDNSEMWTIPSFC